MELQLDLPTARLTLLNAQGLIMWRTPLDRSEIESACFREARVWRAGGVACLGVAERVRFYNLETGALESELALDVLHPSGLSLFGHFGEAILRDGTELLTVLTYTDVIAIDATLEIRWIARNVAVDGVTFAGTRGDFILVNAEVGGAVAGRARGEEQGEGWRVAGSSPRRRRWPRC